ncbi:MAG: MFS transporter, partial [Nostocoides sp.]
MSTTSPVRPVTVEPHEPVPPAYDSGSSTVALGRQPIGRARTAALVSLFLASAMELLDVTIVNVSLPTIERGLHASSTQLQWMIAAYPLAFAIALITGSRLGDRFGRKRLFVIGLVAFTVMSAACGFAATAGTLVVFRALQGLGAAAMVPQVLSSLQVMYPADERAKAMGAFTALAGISTVLGPLLGAILTDADIAGSGWRAIFLVNVPLGIAAIFAALRFIPESRSTRRPGLDVRGVLVLAAGLLAILYPLTMGRELGWPVWVFALIALGTGILGLWLRGQHRAERAGRESLVALSLYRSRGFAGGTGVQVLLFVGISAYFLGQTIYLQAGLGWSVLQAGLIGIPFAVTTAGMAGYGVTVLAAKIGRRVLQVGAFVMVLGLGVLGMTAEIATATTSAWIFVPGLVITGAGFGLMVAPVGIFTLADFPT